MTASLQVHFHRPKPDIGIHTRQDSTTIYVAGLSWRFLSQSIVWIWVPAFRAVYMREEFASRSFLAVSVLGVVLLCSGLLALALG